MFTSLLQAGTFSHEMLLHAIYFLEKCSEQFTLFCTKLILKISLSDFDQRPKTKSRKKSFGVFLLAIHSQLYSFAFIFLFLHTHATSYVFLQFSYCTLDRRKEETWWKTIPIPYGLRNPYRNLHSENCQDYAQKPQRKCTFMNSASDYGKGD